MGFLDLPDRPDEPGRPEQGSASDADRPTPKPRELPDPDERGRVYEAMRAYGSAETAKESSDAAGESQHGKQADGAGQRGYRDELPRFTDMWADHERRWPETRRHAADLTTAHHQDDSPRPSPERQAETAEAIGRVREAEPRLSADAQAIEQENKDTYGGWLEGFDHRIKGEDRLEEKVAEQAGGRARQVISRDACAGSPDAIRYTYCFQPENYTRGYYDIKERLRKPRPRDVLLQELLGPSRVQGSQHPLGDPRGAAIRGAVPHARQLPRQAPSDAPRLRADPRPDDEQGRTP